MDLVDTNRRYTIRIEVKAVTGIPKSDSTRLFGRLRSYYVSVNIDNEIKKTGVRQNIESLEWGESMLLPARKSSVVTLQLHTQHTLLSTSCLGEFKAKLVDLISVVEVSDHHESFITRPLTSGRRRSSKKDMHITFAIKLQVDENDHIKDTIRQANEDVQLLRHTTPLDTVNDMANIGGDQVKQTIDPWISFLRRVKSFVELVNKIAEVHPYAKIAWSVLSFAFKVCASQLERDRNITDLLDAMNEVYAFMDDAKRLEEITPQKRILARLAQQTIDCAYFISSYSKDSSFIIRTRKHAISLTADDAIAEYKAKFTEILDAFNRRAILHTEIATFGITKGMTELVQELDLMDMPYADGARYQRGKQCLAGTRVDILDKISDWVTDMDDKRRVCILTGAAGVGKSSIAHTLARRFDDIRRLGSSFCFSRDQPNRTPDLLIPTLARDIAEKDIVVRKALGDIIHHETSLRKTRDFEDQFDNIFLKSTARLSITGPVFISIDALDESGDVQTRRKFLSVFLRNLDKLPTNMKVFFTSRTENDILELFQDNSDIFFLSIDDSTISTNDDILMFIRDRLVDARGRPLLGFEENQYRRLADKAEQLFQWASVACNVIVGDGKAGSTPLARYNKILSSLGRSASPLDSLYQVVLSQVFDTSDNDTMRSFTEVMGLVLTAYEPFSIATLDVFWKHLGTEMICANNPDGIRSVLKYMGALVTGIHTDYEGVRPLHTSFREFLTEPARSGKFCVDIPTSHSRLSVACLGALNTDLCFNICHLESSYLRNSQITDLSIRIQQHIPCHLSYACRLWGYHLAEGSKLNSSSSRFMTASHRHLRSFLHDHLLHWVEVLSLTKAVNVVFCNLSAAISHLKDKDAGLASLATDGQKFIQTFYGPISESCPHIYLSALPCTPPTSRIYEEYNRLFSKSASIVNGVMSGWPQLQNVVQNKSITNSVGFSPDGRCIVSGSDDHVIRIWDADTGAPIGPPLEGHTDSVQSVAFSPDGKRIVSGSWDKTIRIWDVDAGAFIGAPLEGHTWGVPSVAFSPDGNRIVSGSWDDTIRIWNADTGVAVGLPLQGHRSEVLTVAFSPDGSRIVSGSYDKTIRIWDADTGAALGAFEGHTDSVQSVIFSPDGKRVISGSWDKTIRVWDADTGAAVGAPMYGHTNGVRSVALSPDGKYIVSGSWDKTIRTWDVDTGAAVGVPLEGHTDPVLSVAFSPDGNRIISGSDDRTIRIWSTDTGTTKPLPAGGHTDSVLSVAFLPDGNRVVSGSLDGIIRIWGSEKGAAVGEQLGGHTRGVLSVATSPDGNYIASGSLDKTIRIWDADTGAAMGAPLQGHASGVQSVAFSPDGKRIVSGSFDDTIRIWDVDTGTALLAPLKGHIDTVQSVAFSPDGDRIVSGSLDKSIRIWDADTGSAVGAPLEGHTGLVRSVSFSPDGNHIVSGSDDRTIRIWNTNTGVAIQVLKGHDHIISSVSFSQDGKRIVSGSYDKTIRIWDADTGAAVRVPFEGHTDPVLSVAFSLDGNRVVSGSSDKVIRIWDANTGTVLGSPFEAHIQCSVRFFPGNNLIVSNTEENSLCTFSTDLNITPNNSDSVLFGQNAVTGQTSNTTVDVRHSSSPLGLFSLTSDHALRLGDLSFRTGSLEGITYNVDSGWILGPADELIFYVHPSLRNGLIAPGNIAIYGAYPVEINFSRFVHGTSWSGCYVPMSS